MLREQMLFKGFRPFKLSMANITGVPYYTAMSQHMLFQGSFGVQSQVAFRTMIFCLVVRVYMLDQCACCFITFLTNWTDVTFVI